MRTTGPRNRRHPRARRAAASPCPGLPLSDTLVVVQNDIAQILIDREAIGRRLDELAEQIIADLRAEQGGGGTGGDGGGQGDEPAEITLVPILTGSIIFVADLIRRLPIRMQIRLLSISSYPGRSTLSRGAAIEQALTRLPDSLEGLHVLVIDDILDSGRTLKLACRTIARRNPANIRTCVLLRKRRPEAMDFDVDYVAFDIPDAFVVGYGLDYDDYYRNLPDIVTLKDQVIAGAAAVAKDHQTVHGSRGV